MTMFDPHSRRRNDTYRRPDEIGGFGPQFGFAAATLGVFAAWTGAVHTLPSHYVMPIVATLLFILAALFSLVAWRRGRQDPSNVTYWDVAGALTLIGLCATATIDGEQVQRIVAA
jgi:hypothetical protein